jgi:hypothetical protein
LTEWSLTTTTYKEMKISFFFLLAHWDSTEQECEKMKSKKFSKGESDQLSKLPRRRVAALVDWKSDSLYQVQKFVLALAGSANI